MNSNGLDKPIQPIVDYAMRRPVVRFFMNLGCNEGWEGTVDVANATFNKTKTTLKKITCPHAFAENGQWNVVCMKEEFHAKFVTIL
jgi:hypothetical protein